MFTMSSFVMDIQLFEHNLFGPTKFDVWGGIEGRGEYMAIIQCPFKTLYLLWFFRGLYDIFLLS